MLTSLWLVKTPPLVAAQQKVSIGQVRYTLHEHIVRLTSACCLAKTIAAPATVAPWSRTLSNSHRAERGDDGDDGELHFRFLEED